MQREIKFRAFDDGKMIYHDQVQPILIENNNHLEQFFKTVRPNAIIMQYTGLKDRNGKDIYEDDIVYCCRYSNNELHKVVVKDIRQLPENMFGSNLNWREVVGNIHESPHLVS